MAGCDLSAVSAAISGGLQRGALICEKSGTAFAIEVITAESDRVLAIVQCPEENIKLLKPASKVRVELPREGSVVWVRGNVVDCRPDFDGELVEVEIACSEAEIRTRRMDVRIEEMCTVRALEGRGDEMTARALSISAEGGLIISDCAAKVGDRVEVRFSLGELEFCCRAEVERRGVKVNGAVSRSNAALKLLGLSNSDLEKIGLFVLSAQAKNKAARR